MNITVSVLFRSDFKVILTANIEMCFFGVVSLRVICLQGYNSQTPNVFVTNR